MPLFPKIHLSRSWLYKNLLMQTLWSYASNIPCLALRKYLCEPVWRPFFSEVPGKLDFFRYSEIHRSFPQCRTTGFSLSGPNGKSGLLANYLLFCFCCFRFFLLRASKKDTIGTIRPMLIHITRLTPERPNRKPIVAIVMPRKI